MGRNAQAKLPTGQGSNSIGVRRFNERVVLAALRRLGTASKAELSRHSNLTQNTTGLITRDLIKARLVREVGRREGSRGQPATLLSLDPHGTFSIGVKIGRRSLAAVVVDFAGTILHLVERERPLPAPAQALQETIELVETMRAAAPRKARGRLAGIGVAMPYDLDCWRRELDLPGDELAAWQGFDFDQAFCAAIDVPVVVENDGTAVAVAELFNGHGRDLQDFVSIYIADALGGGVVLRGDFRRGFVGNAGDIGLIPTLPSGLATAPQPRGALDILLTRSSISSLMRHLKAKGVPIVTRADLEAAVHEHEGLVADWLDDCCEALATPLQSIGAILDVEAIIVDGDFDGALIGRLVALLQGRLDDYAPEARKAPRLLQGRIGRNAAAIGAALLPLHLNFSPDQRLLFGTAA